MSISWTTWWLSWPIRTWRRCWRTSAREPARKTPLSISMRPSWRPMIPRPGSGGGSTTHRSRWCSISSSPWTTSLRPASAWRAGWPILRMWWSTTGRRPSWTSRAARTEASCYRRWQEERPKVLILDPACGTGTFLYAVMDFIRAEFMKRGDAGLWSAYVRDHLLPRLIRL